MLVKGETLVDLLRRRADAQPDERAYGFLDSGETQGASLTWAQLDLQARALAANLAGQVDRGGRVLVLCPPGLDFVPAFFGVLFAGAVVVPCYPPRPGRPDRSLERLISIARDAAIEIVLAPASVLVQLDALRDDVPELRAARWLALEQVSVDAAVDWSDPGGSPEALALLQYTSGSTREPRGVMVSHANLVANLGYADRLARHGSRSLSVSWLPVNHDMGLIQGVLQGVYSGFPSYLMSPAAFLQRPARWLAAISRLRATLSGGPNFAYDLCVERIPAAERARLDLRCWSVAFNGAEPVRRQTLEAFARSFAPCGFRARAFRPAYGLAEATLLVSAGRGISQACGAPGAGTSVRIVDPLTRESRADGELGEIWVSGPGVAQGYWRRPDETAAVFAACLSKSGEGPYLRTGDLGFIRAGELEIAGRIKDLLIVRGVKHHPQDLEATAAGVSRELRAGCCAAFAVSDSDERVAIAAEMDPWTDRSRMDVLIAGIRQAIAETHGVAIHAVLLLEPGSLPKTTSGKLERHTCPAGFATGMLAPLAAWIHESLDARPGARAAG